MIEEFVKYHSFGNDLILLDWQKRSEDAVLEMLKSSRWPSFVRKYCDRHFGIGGDGILILKRKGLDYEMQIFNADGSEAETCLNGIRCMAYHLSLQYPKETEFRIFSAHRWLVNRIDPSSSITTTIPFACYLQMQTILTPEGEFQGHCVNVGNPHFVILQKQDPLWLSQHGHCIEEHPSFPNKTNVSFVWSEEPRKFRVLFYERGCGLTLACSSGAVAIMATLHRLERISKNEETHLLMQGGTLRSMVTKDGDVLLTGKADLVFSGICHL